MGEMPDILARICRAKRREVEELTGGTRCAFQDAVRQQEAPRGFRAALTADERVALIAEVKKASPSAGVIRADFDPVAIARCYERAGAAAVSVLTDRDFFQGEPAYLARVREGVSLPVLRKDFILDPVQVLEARALGADACLLIVAALDREELSRLLDAVREHLMDALVEVHDERELETALDAGAELVGINNRDLRTFEVSLQTTERLAELIPCEVAFVSESGIKTRADVERLKECGVNAVLVGETLMRADDTEAAVQRLLGL